MNNYLRRLIMVAIPVLVVGGCYEDARVNLHEPHVYSGKADPHSDDAATRAKKLQARFLNVQTDR